MSTDWGFGGAMLSVLAADDVAGTTAYGIVAGVLSFLLSRVLYDVINAAIQRTRLTTALLVDCVATLNKFDAILPDLKRMVDRHFGDGTAGVTASADVSVQRVRELISGFWVSPPLDSSRDLIPLLPALASRNIVHFFDRWSLFLLLESKYADIYPKLLESAINNSEGTSNEATSEFWEQAVRLLNHMHSTANELCFFSCLIIRRHGPTSDFGLKEICDGHFKSWTEWTAARDRYEAAGF